MPKLVVLLDDGGVMNDNSVRGGQWQRLVGEYFAPRLGGAPGAWAAANKAVIDRLMAAGGWDGLMRAAPDYAAYEENYFVRWLTEMCAEVGVPAPPVVDCVAQGVAAETYIIPRVWSAFPGAVDAIRTLSAAGYTLHTASGGGSRLLGMYLEAMGVRACFGRLYGSDLIETFKIAPDYYARILADLALPAEAALFVDDSPRALSWAAEVGARTLLVAESDAGGFKRVGSLAEVPEYLRKMGEA